MDLPYPAEARNLGHLFQLSCHRWSDRVAMSVPEGKTRREVTFGELYELAYRYACVLKELSLQSGDRITIFSENCMEWAVLDWACHTSGISLVPIYPTLPADQASYIVRDCNAKLVVAGSVELQKKISGAFEVPVMLLRQEEGSIAERAKTASGDREAWEANIPLASPDDVATIIYTSGTTGEPKGAMLLQRNFLDSVRSIRSFMDITENDVFLSFLPLSHVYERTNGHILPTSVGAKIAYAGSLASLASDMATCQPTIMLCVPRFLESMKEKITESMRKQPPLRQRLFHLALAQGQKRLHGQFAPLHTLADRLVGTKIRERTGGRLRFFVSGGMRMPMGVYEFFGAFGILVLQGYGLTETTSGMAFNAPHDNMPETAGRPIPGVDIKIADDGEILIRGWCVMAGYHNLPEATAAAIDAEGWFHSGDVGHMDNGHIVITDRKKDLIVLGNGKNVAPQKIEDLLRNDPLIAEAVLFGDGENYVGGLIVPNAERLAEFAAANGLSGNILESDSVKQLFKRAVDSVNQGLADFEKVKKYRLIDAKFSVETGELTPSLKVKRRVIKERFAEEIAGLFR